MSKKYYTVNQINKMIPELEQILRRILQMHIQVQSLCQRLDDCGYLPENEEINIQPAGAAPEVMQDLASVQLLITAINDELQKLDDMGGIIKDIEIGLIDWYGKTKDGQEVFLCWQLGDKAINHWHEIDAGFTNRKPISQLL